MKRTPSPYKIVVYYALFGFVFGALFPIAVLLISLSITGRTVTYETVTNFQSAHSFMWYLDLAPLLFGALCAGAGFQLTVVSRNLYDEKNLLNTLIDNIPDRIYAKDLQGKNILSNKADWSAFGFKSSGDVIGKTPFELFPKEIAQKHWNDDQEIINGKEIIECEEFSQDAHGNPVWSLATEVPIYDIDGNVRGMVGISRNITKRKEAERKLADAIAIQSLILENSTLGIGLVRNRKFQWVNNRLAELLGLEKEKIQGESTRVLYPSNELYEELGRTAYAVLKSGERSDNTYQLRRSDGTLFWCRFIGKALNPKKVHDGTIWMFDDITEEKQAEDELLRQKLFFESLVSTSPVAIVVLDGAGKISSCNPAFEKLYGYSSAEVVNEDLDSLLTTPEMVTEAREITHKVTNGAVHEIGKRKRKDGTLVDVEIFGVPIIINGKNVGSLGLYHDISDLLQARHEAEEANIAKSEFLANMSHEIRTPMNGVIGMLELALDTQLTAEQRDFLNVSMQSAELLLGLINDILDFSKIEAKKLVLENIDFNLRNTVEDVAYTLAKKAQDKGLELACLIHPDLLSDIRGDPGRIRQIIVNLAGNAIKFTNQGEIVIRAEPLEVTDTSVKIHFSIQDTGIGIPPERQEHIFDRFTQADGSTTRKYGGTGLGLAISKQLVDLMNGQIGVISTLGEGSTFWFDITFQKQPEGKGRPLMQVSPAQLKDVHILGVDDNATNRMILTKVVEGFGCRFEVAASGEEGVQMLQTAVKAGDPFKLILLDMQMPGLDGEQTAKMIKADPALSDLKIVILTSMGQRGDAVRLEQLGCNGYLLKPVKQQVLKDMLISTIGMAEEEKPVLVTRHILSEQRRQGKTILLAEDNPVNQRLAIVLLQKAGYSVDAVSNGKQAVDQVKKKEYHAVLMDVQMPEMDGFDATRLIREWEKEVGGHIPIIAMTAYALKGDQERCLQAGMDDYTMKPLNMQAFLKTIDEWTVKYADLVKTGDHTH